MRFLAVFTFALAATGAQADSAMDGYFRSLDLDGDGYVSLAEAAGDPVVVNRFDRADKNHDGKLSRKEFANLKRIKVRVAKKKDKDKPPSAAVGGSAPVRRKSTRSWADGG